MSQDFTTVTPALVTEKAVRRLPRWALLAFCAAYVLPGLFGRDPWKNADIAAFGQMWSLALGQASWWAPHVGGVPPASGGILPYWLGGGAIALLHPWVDPALAARLPFAALLGVILALTWYATYHLARSEAARPLPLAFGGEAPLADYARALADGALMALIASLGLLQLGHETTPEILQLTGVVLFIYGMAAAQWKPMKARWATVGAVALMAGSGSPVMAQWLCLIGVLVCLRSVHSALNRHLPWVLLAAMAGLFITSSLSLAGLAGWQWRTVSPWNHVGSIVRQWMWFTWPVLPLAALTVWTWRRQTLRLHIALPLLVALVGLLSSVAMGGDERALLHALPALAVLSAFALPTLKRSVSSAMDWFSVFFFTIINLAIWLVFAADHTGWPAATARAIARLVPGHEARFSGLALAVAVLATVSWLWLVRWRTARHRPALWKSLVLPAGGVALGWLLLMTLMLPVLDQSRSYRLLIERVGRHVPAGSCVVAPGASVGLLTALEYFGGHSVHGGPDAEARGGRRCEFMVLSIHPKARAPRREGWQYLTTARQRTERSESVALYRRVPAAQP